MTSISYHIRSRTMTLRGSADAIHLVKTNLEDSLKEVWYKSVLQNTLSAGATQHTALPGSACFDSAVLSDHRGGRIQSNKVRSNQTRFRYKGQRGLQCGIRMDE